MFTKKKNTTAYRSTSSLINGTIYEVNPNDKKKKNFFTKRSSKPGTASGSSLDVYRSTSSLVNSSLYVSHLNQNKDSSNRASTSCTSKSDPKKETARGTYLSFSPDLDYGSASNLNYNSTLFDSILSIEDESENANDRKSSKLHFFTFKKKKPASTEADSKLKMKENKKRDAKKCPLKLKVPLPEDEEDATPSKFAKFRKRTIKSRFTEFFKEYNLGWQSKPKHNRYDKPERNRYYKALAKTRLSVSSSSSSSSSSSIFFVKPHRAAPQPPGQKPPIPPPLPELSITANTLNFRGNNKPASGTDAPDNQDSVNMSFQEALLRKCAQIGKRSVLEFPEPCRKRNSSFCEELMQKINERKKKLQLGDEKEEATTITDGCYVKVEVHFQEEMQSITKEDNKPTFQNELSLKLTKMQKKLETTFQEDLELNSLKKNAEAKKSESACKKQVKFKEPEVDTHIEVQPTFQNELSLKLAQMKNKKLDEKDNETLSFNATVQEDLVLNNFKKNPEVKKNELPSKKEVIFTEAKIETPTEHVDVKSSFQNELTLKLAKMHKKLLEETDNETLSFKTTVQEDLELNSFKKNPEVKKSELAPKKKIILTKAEIETPTKHVDVKSNFKNELSLRLAKMQKNQLEQHNDETLSIKTTIQEDLKLNSVKENPAVEKSEYATLKEAEMNTSKISTTTPTPPPPPPPVRTSSINTFPKPKLHQPVVESRTIKGMHTSQQMNPNFHLELMKKLSQRIKQIEPEPEPESEPIETDEDEAEIPKPANKSLEPFDMQPKEESLIAPPAPPLPMFLVPLTTTAVTKTLTNLQPTGGKKRYGTPQPNINFQDELKKKLEQKINKTVSFKEDCDAPAPIASKIVKPEEILSNITKLPVVKTEVSVRKWKQPKPDISSNKLVEVNVVSGELPKAGINFQDELKRRLAARMKKNEAKLNDSN